MDVFFYGYGDKFRARVDAGARRRAVADAAEVDFALGGRDFRGDTGNARCDRRRPVQRLRARDLGGARQPLHHPPLARHGLRVVVVPAVRARLGGRGDRREPLQRDRALVRAGLGADRRRRRAARRSTPTAAARRSGPGRGDGRAARASACSTSTPTATARGGCSSCRPAGARRMSTDGRAARSRSSPPTTRSRTSAASLDELRAFDSGLDVVVVSDGSTDRTAEVASGSGRARGLSCRSTSASAARCRPGSASRGRTATSSSSAATATASTIPGRAAEGARAGASPARPTSRSARASSARRRTARRPARRVGIRLLALVVSAIARAAAHRHHVGLPGAEPAGARALRRRLPARLPRGRGRW